MRSDLNCVCVCSVSRLLRLLQCYDHTHPIVLGEGYGYEAAKPRGITFITGGGG